jgi:hypothetical protein
VPLGWFSLAMRLLACTVLQNVWPVNHYSEIGYERARFMFGIVDEGTYLSLHSCNRANDRGLL